ncbi:uncharacterized protein [Primulina eburnea]|uniref:uncharacterized protein n=1 Tax=Primulina eburnea TaxID=1245227 RepID=UPI003C6BFFEC
MTAVDSNTEGIFFVYRYGGTGKTFIWKTMSACLRSNGEIFLNVTSSGIASLLLLGGRTAHSRFSIPFNPTEESTSNIKQGSPLAELIVKSKLIIWDEASTHKFCFEALDKRDGKIGEENDGYATIYIPNELLLKDYNDPIATIVESTYPLFGQLCNIFPAKSYIGPEF